MSPELAPVGQLPPFVAEHSCDVASQWARHNGLWPVLISAIDDKRFAESSRGKAPLGGEGWGLVLQDVRWFASSFRRNPKANVGLLLGPQGKVVDIDVDDPEKAAPILARIFPDGIPATLGWKNLGGKFHLLFLWDDRLLEYIGKSGVIKGGPNYPGLELRLGGAGKQIQSVIPPSMLANGQRRKWNGNSTILPLPESFFLDLATYGKNEKPRKARPPQSKPTIKDSGDAVSRYSQRALTEEVANVINAPDGERNDTLNRAAFALGQLIPHLSRGEIIRELTRAAEDVKLPADETAKTIASGINAGVLEPRDLSHVGRNGDNSHGPKGYEAQPEYDGGNGQHTPEPSANGDGRHSRDNERPPIVISTEEHRSIDQATFALATAPDIYQAQFRLVTVRRDMAPPRGVERNEGVPQIAALPTPTVRELITRHGRCIRYAKDESGEWEEVPVHPTDWLVLGTAARGVWAGIRHLAGIVESPILRHDGTILDRPGYDDATGLLFEPCGEFRPVKDRPTLEDAREAAKLLLYIVVDFPFAVIEYPDGTNDGGATHRVAWLAALLTPLARFAIDGPCPMFMIDANVPGSGKSLLTDIIAIICTWRAMPRTTYPDSDEEMRKRITAIALAHYWVMLVDNIASTFGGSSLDSALTATTWRDRVLGKSETTPELPLTTVWYGSGNNVAYRGDVLRRIVPCRLESAEENPESRKGFAIADLVGYVKKERPKLIAACLTILRAYVVAGRPDQGLTPLGSYESWSSVVRNAIFWTLGVDPCATREGMKSNDPEAIGRVALINGWSELPNGAGSVGVTAAEALSILREEKTKYGTLRDVVMGFSRNGELPSTKSLGMRLNAIRGRIIDRKRFVSKSAGKGTMAWFVESIKGDLGGTSGTSGTNSGTPRTSDKPNVHYVYDVMNDEALGDGAGISPTSPTSPTRSLRASETCRDNGNTSPPDPDGEKEVFKV